LCHPSRSSISLTRHHWLLGLMFPNQPDN
jgi:hypothetical protein